MTEDEARAWLQCAVPRETIDKLEYFVELLREETANQNLISASSADQIWARHIVDSAQLLSLDTNPNSGSWVDIGTGAGFPGMVIAITGSRPVIMVEPRPRRAEFLQQTADRLSLKSSVLREKIENFHGKAAVISARAVAPAPALFDRAHHLVRTNTLWLLPKGKSAQSELAQAQQAWQGAFHVKQSVTDPEAGIIVAQGVRRRRA